MAKSTHNTLDQIDLTIDLLLSQLFALRNNVTKLRENMADVSTPALGNGTEQVLSDEHIAQLLTRRQNTRAKKGKRNY
jgi:hypothetical protein